MVTHADVLPLSLSPFILNYCTYVHTHTHLRTSVPPVNTSISLLTDMPVRKGRDFRLRCDSKIDHSPRFTWIHNGANLTNLTIQLAYSRYVVDADQRYLTVKEATYGDAGLYSCVATNKAGSDIANLTVDVEGEQ